MHFFIFDHYVPALKIAEHKIFMIHIAEVIAQCFKIIDQFFFVIRDLKGIQEIIFEIQQITQDGLLAKFFRSETLIIIQFDHFH